MRSEPLSEEIIAMSIDERSERKTASGDALWEDQDRGTGASPVSGTTTP